MCGIFGAVRLVGYFTAEDFPRFVAQTDLVRYRGPDDAGYRAFAVRAADRREDLNRFDVFLGHRRLAIIDLSPQGHQPLTDGEGRWIIFVGEIFNYVELRDELRRRGHRFRTGTDTEVILKVYQEYGEGGFSQLNGMWAFAILDINCQRLILSRDRFSIKGLYYVHRGDELFFGSEIKQLLPFVPRREIERDLMYAYLTQALADHTDRTLFEGIRAVPAKHNLVLDLRLGSSELRRYWNYTIEPVPDSEAIQAFRQVFIDSVRIRLRSDVEVGALLSGGLDSSSVAVVANQLLGAGLQTYSVVARDPRYSEHQFVDVLARTGIQNHRLEYESDSALQALDQVVYHNDEPCYGFSPVATYRILELIKAETGLKVVLSGQGGDECLLGYKKFFFFYLAELLKRGRILRAMQQAVLSWFRGTVLRQFAFGEARRYMPWTRSPQPYVLLRREHEAIGLARDVRERQIRDLDRLSIPILAHWDDRLSMAHSIELRTPFLDHRLVNLALSLATEWKIRDGWPKYILRQALPELPAPIRWRRDKQGFLTPEEHWLRHELRPKIEQLFGDGQSRLEALGVIDARLFLAAYRRFVAGDFRAWFGDFTRVLIAEIWARRFFA
ncbi:MAG TPA: asparagine synthase (glutamine-hydrolyzing) [Gemmatimonadales bacterium]|nr:asparagine synthase (glutamine-hydrolyzing) [Gemmatimonadales bacterium]